MPDASTQTKRVVISEVADHDFEGFVIVSREGESGPTPTIGDRLLEADRCGNAIAAFIEGYSTHLPKPKRWGTFAVSFGWCAHPIQQLASTAVGQRPRRWCKRVGAFGSAAQAGSVGLPCVRQNTF